MSKLETVNYILRESAITSPLLLEHIDEFLLSNTVTNIVIRSVDVTLIDGLISEVVGRIFMVISYDNEVDVTEVLARLIYELITTLYLHYLNDRYEYIEDGTCELIVNEITLYITGQELDGTQESEHISILITNLFSELDEIPELVSLKESLNPDSMLIYNGGSARFNGGSRMRFIEVIVS